MIVKGAAQAHQRDRRIPELFSDLLPLRFAQRDFNAMRVACAQFHTLELRLGTVPNDGWKVPIFCQVVGHRAQADLRRFREGRRRFFSGKTRLVRESQRAQSEPGRNEDIAACTFSGLCGICLHGGNG